MKKRTAFRSRRGIAQKWLIIGGVAAALLVGMYLLKKFKGDSHQQDYRHDGFYQQNYSQTVQDNQDWATPPKKGGYTPRPGWRNDGYGDLEPEYRHGPRAAESDADVPGDGEDQELARLKAAADAAQLRLETASRDKDSAAMMDAQTELTSARNALNAKIRSML